MRSMKTLLRLLGAVSLTTVAASSVVACGDKGNKPKPPAQKTNLNTIITDQQLGVITMAGSTPTAVELLQAIKSKNPKAQDLTTNDFKFKSNPIATSATIVGQGQYQGEVTLSYSKKQAKTDLNTIITNKNLDKIYIGQLNIPNEEQILKAIKSKNPKAQDLTTGDFTFKTGSPGATSATIVGQGQYQGEVTLSYSKKQAKTDLNTIITNKNLDKI